MPRTPPKDPKRIGSFSELRAHYIVLYSQLEDCRKMRGATNEALRHRTGEVRGTQEELKKARRDVVTLTKKEHAQSKERSSAAFASTGATVLIIGYQLVEVSGGWGRWSPVFEHEATIGVLQVIIGTIIAWAMRPLR